MKRTLSAGIRLALAACLIFAALFVVIGGWTTGYSLESVIWLALTGAIFGAIGAPVIEPKAFRYPALWQVGCAVAGCLLVAALLGASIDGYLLAVALGVLLGYLAPYWITRVTGP
ncbi:hypothetical protein [Achromobacter xylosoxidans]|uniref:hypothetical protein n=1 Tax=Alcaligenes xylosoxydans xylosoxydans TaxID=85698 RepID=UPI000668C4FF|nr:hypothetical protein [Achromobacter xylosoxidans]